VSAIGGAVGAAKSALSIRWAAAKRRWAWLDHVAQAWAAYKAHHGDLFAAAVTFFSFLSLFPLILLGVSAAGFVLRAQPSLQTDLFNSIESNVPGSFGTTLKDSIDAAIKARAGVGVIGLVGVLFTGLGWVSNLRSATEGVWGQEPAQRSMIGGKVADLLLLAGLGLGAVLSISLTVVGSALTGAVLRALGLEHATGLAVLTTIVGLALAVCGDMLIFGWLLIRLPRAQVRLRVGVRAALMAAVGFEILKLVGTYYIARVTKSPTVGIFGSVIGILVWLNLVSRFLLFCVAWTATARGTSPDAEGVPEPVERIWPLPAGGVASARAHGQGESRISPAATAAALVGAGAAAGAAGAGLVSRRWRARRRARRV
jgi:membrane protein